MSTTDEKTKEILGDFRDISSSASSLLDLFSDLLDRVEPRGGYLCEAGEALVAKIGLIADRQIAKHGEPCVRGDAGDWLNLGFSSVPIDHPAE